MDKEFLWQLFVQFSPQILELIILIAGLLVINAFKKQGASKEQIALIESAYEILTRAARTTNQIWVEAIKKAGGKLTEEEAEQARKDTIETFKQMITEAMQFAIEQAYGSIDKWIELNLESAVNSVKDIYIPIVEIEEQ